MNIKSVVLCILDGWGIGADNQYNAIWNVNPPCWQYILSNYPKCSLSASGHCVGLPDGQIGNSEVGHMNIGSGRVATQSLQRINQEINTIENNENLKSFINKIKSKNGICHIIGLISDGGIHSHQKHIAVITNQILQQGINVAIHAFLDGRDTSPQSGRLCIQKFQNEVISSNIVTISGRYYAMDRDNRWERTIEAYNAIALAQAPRYNDVLALIDENYSNNITDEFIKPAVINDYHGIKQEDGILLANFRTDRMLQLASLLLDKAKTVKFSSILSMMQYSKNLNIPYIFPPMSFINTLGQVISDNGLKQLRIAETEKYAHVTYFFNCGREKPFPGEERILVPSPKVETYDLQPEMSAFELTEKLIRKMCSKEFALIVANYANPDMVGHTGNIKSAERAVKVVGNCLSKVLQTIKGAEDTILIITADHGNVECMFDEENNTLHTAHTLNNVPFVICANLPITLRDGKLSDIASTILHLLRIKKPIEMTGNSLISSFF
jgi:2,3-bisphosphoglycerate-independent phosphoglycerate mutase